jgi:uncharacterized membrane protein YkvA (DUF1232 family)
VINRLKEWAQRLKCEVVALWLCTRHPRTPFLPKALAMALVAYALSPIDLIPDFIPVLGYLDDLIILPVGIWLVLKMVPEDVMAECRIEAVRWLEEKRPKPRSRLGATIIITIWAAGLILILWLAWQWAGPRLAA